MSYRKNRLFSSDSDADVQPSLFRWQSFIGGFVLFLVLIIAYSNSFEGPFVFDGKYTIRDNYRIRQLWPIWDHIISPLEGSTVHGRPVANLSLVLNYATGGLDVTGYHVFNFTVHLIASMFCFGLVSRTLELKSAPPTFRRRSFLLGLVIAVLWSVHPLQTGSVTYINQRVEAMMGLFYLATLYCFVRGATDESGGRKWFVLSVIACMLGMATKEVMISAPVMVLLYDRTFLAGSFRKAWHSRRSVYLGLATALVLSAFLVIRTGDRRGTAGFTGDVSSWQYLLTQCDMITQYLRLAIWPHPLVFYYGKERLVHTLPAVWPQATFLLVLFTSSMLALRYRPWLGFLGFWFFAILSPSSSFIPIATELGAEHRMYLPLLAVVSLIVVIGYWLHRQFKDRSKADGPAGAVLKRIIPVLTVVLIVIFMYMTYGRNKDYHTLVSLWKDTTVHDPTNYGAFDNLGCAYREADEYRESIESLTKAIELNPDCEDCYQERGFTYAMLGMHEKSLEDYDKAVSLKPDFYIVYFKRGSSLVQMGRYDEAVRAFNKAVEIEPEFTAGYDMRGYAHVLAGRYEQAMDDFSKAIELNPRLPYIYHHRAELYYQLGEYDKAWMDIEHLRRLGGDANPSFLKELLKHSR